MILIRTNRLIYLLQRNSAKYEIELVYGFHFILPLAYCHNIHPFGCLKNGLMCNAQLNVNFIRKENQFNQPRPLGLIYVVECRTCMKYTLHCIFDIVTGNIFGRHANRYGVYIECSSHTYDLQHR